jgi:carbamoyl-phosphate synthase large subunit
MPPRQRLLVMAAGTGACNNLVRSLKAGAAGVYIVGCNDDRFTLKQSSADRLYLTPPVTAAEFESALLRLLDREKIDLVIPSGDGDVLALSTLRHKLGSRCFLPEAQVIGLCQDKFDLTQFLATRGVPVPATCAVTHLNKVGAIFKQLGRPRLLWCRVRVGSRSLGAAPVNTVRQARAWIRYWEEMRGIPPDRFTLSEYLPGRDFMCMSLWRDGQMVLVTTFEKLSYFGGESHPSGTSSLSSLAKTIRDDRLVDISNRAIRAISPEASGAFSIDLKENAEGVPCITEINAGRFFIGMTAFDQVSKHNTSAVYVRLAFREPLHLRDAYVTVPDHYVVRDLDALPGVLSVNALFAGINPWLGDGRRQPETRHASRQPRAHRSK